MQLDDSYCCGACGKMLEILGWWNKRLIVDDDAHRLDVLCYKIYLSSRLLGKTLRFKGLHNIIKDVKSKLGTEVGTMNGIFAKMAHGIVNRLFVAGDVQKLCCLAIEEVVILLERGAIHNFISGLPRAVDVDIIMIVVNQLTENCHFVALQHPFIAKEIAQKFISEVVRLHGFSRSIVPNRDKLFIGQL